MAATKKTQARPVVVTTAHRGVFVGFVADETKDEITLTDARMIVYWSADAGGVVGIATRGAGKSARVSPAVKRIRLTNITAVIDATEEAATDWAKETWK